MIKACCYNCHYYLSDWDHCPGMEDLDDKCHEHIQSKEKDKNNSSLWVNE